MENICTKCGSVICPKCGSPTRIQPAGVGKKTHRPYNAFKSCTSRSCNWTETIAVKVNTKSTPGTIGATKKQETHDDSELDDIVDYKNLPF